jgi:histidinol-phosphate aminotransferase
MAILAPKPKLPEIQKAIRDCATYQPGKPIEELERELGIKNIIKLASNENPLGPSPKAMAAINKHLNELHLYPDASHYRLREALAGRLGVDLEEIMVGCGSEEIFSLLIRSYCQPGDNNVGCGAAFLAYRVCSQVHGTEYREPPLDKNPEREGEEILKLVDDRTRIVFLPNPNNPTGTYLNRKTMKQLLDALRGRNLIVLLDYAYKEYARASDLPDPMEFYKEMPNLIVTRTFSKIYGLGGLRVGYGIAHPDLLLPLRKVKTPFNVSSLGLAGALAALEDEDHVRRSIELNNEGMDFLVKEFQRMGLDFWPSQGNFLLTRMPKDAKRIYDEMLKLGIILRPTAGYGLKEYLRITIGTMPENRRMIAGLEKTLGAM